MFVSECMMASAWLTSTAAVVTHRSSGVRSRDQRGINLLYIIYLLILLYKVT